jgi:hypothetical protein
VLSLIYTYYQYVALFSVYIIGGVCLVAGMARASIKTDEQRITSKLTSKVGEAATTQVRTLRFNDEDAVAPLLELQLAYPNAAIYLNGSLTVNFPL